MIITKTSITGISSIFTTASGAARRHLSFGSGFLVGSDTLFPNAGFSGNFRTEDPDGFSYGTGSGTEQPGYNYHRPGTWNAWCTQYGQIAGSLVLRGGTFVDLDIEQSTYGRFAGFGGSGTITLIDLTVIMSYHAGGDNTVASHVYGFRSYNRIIYNSSGTPAVARNTYYGTSSGSGSLDTGNFTIVVSGGVPCFRITPTSSNAATTTKFNFFGQIVQSY